MESESHNYYVYRNDTQSGPFDRRHILLKLRNGDFSSDDLCCQLGWDEWKTLGSVFNFNSSITINGKRKIFAIIAFILVIFAFLTTLFFQTNNNIFLKNKTPAVDKPLQSRVSIQSERFESTTNIPDSSGTYKPVYPSNYNLSVPSYKNVLALTMEEHMQMFYHHSGKTSSELYPHYNSDFSFNGNDYRIRTYTCNMQGLLFSLLYLKEDGRWNCVFASFSHYYSPEHRSKYNIPSITQSRLGNTALRMININENNQPFNQNEWKTTDGCNLSGSPLWVSSCPQGDSEHIYASRLNAVDVNSPYNSIAKYLLIFNEGICKKYDVTSSNSEEIIEINTVYEYQR